jgi:hypothetical protein
MITGDVGITAQVTRVMQNITAVLGAANASWKNVVKTTIFLTDLGDFQAVNAVYSTYFDASPPARSTIQVAALPRGAAVEIEVIAYVGELVPRAASITGDFSWRRQRSTQRRQVSRRICSRRRANRLFRPFRKWARTSRPISSRRG